MSKRLNALLLTFVASVAAAGTEVSWYFPGVGTEAVSASEIGAGPDGTTLLLEPAGPVTASEIFTGAATLVQAPSSEILVYSDATESLSEGCFFSAGDMVCAVGYAVTGVTTFATTISVPLSPTAPGSSTTSSPSAASSSSSSSGAGAAQTNTPNGAARLGLPESSTIFLGVVGAAILVLN